MTCAIKSFIRKTQGDRRLEEVMNGCNTQSGCCNDIHGEHDRPWAIEHVTNCDKPYI